METWAKHLVSPKILWITLSLISWALCQAEKSCNCWQHWVCVRAGSFMHVYIAACVFLIFFVGPFALLTVLFECLCVYSVRLDSRIYVYSMCFLNYKGIFHSVMLINLISKSRNMKQELKNRLPLWLDVCQHTFSQFFFSSAFFFIQQKNVLTGGDCADLSAKGFMESNGVTMVLAPLSVL